MKKTKQPKPVKKSSLIIAWILLILLLLSAAALTYLKFYSQNQNLTTPTVDTNQTPDEKTITPPTLEQIVTNFNNSTLVAEYQKQGISLTAQQTENVLTIEYKTTTTISTYQFILYVPILTITTTEETNQLEFNEIYKNIVYAIQTSLGNNETIEEDLNQFLTNNIEIEGLTKKEIDNTTKYNIDITKIIKSTTTPNENSTSTSSTTTTTDQETNSTVDDTQTINQNSERND